MAKCCCSALQYNQRTMCLPVLVTWRLTQLISDRGAILLQWRVQAVFRLSFMMLTALQSITVSLTTQ